MLYYKNMEISAQTFKEAKKVHIIGIGGSGISGIARFLNSRGVHVTGSELSAYSTTEALEREGITVHVGQDESQIPEGTELVIYTVARQENNAGLTTARERGIPTITYPQSLSYISADHTTIAVAGTHGKTTTTAMLGELFMDSGLSPTIIVGSVMARTKSNFVAGTSEYFIVEACEYRRSFLNLTPTITCITNIDADHLDYYEGGMADIQKAFVELLGRSVKGGVCITDTQHPNIVPVVERVRASRPDITFVDYTKYYDRAFALQLTALGQHNKKNAAVALAVADARGIDLAMAEQSLTTFAGTSRRFEYKGLTESGAQVYDDYAHHPTEIAATLEAATSNFPNQRIVAVFQPHLYSRTREHFEQFVSAWKSVDEVWFMPIYAAREVLDPSIDHTQLTKRAVEQGMKAHAGGTFEETAAALQADLKKDDICLVLGAGSITDLASMLVSKPVHEVS